MGKPIRMDSGKSPAHHTSGAESRAGEAAGAPYLRKKVNAAEAKGRTTGLNEGSRGAVGRETTLGANSLPEGYTP